MRIISSLAGSAVALLLAATSAHAATTAYPAWQSTIKYTKTSTGASGYGNLARVTSTVLYDPSTDTYTIRDTGSLTTKSSFAPANIDAGSSNATFTVYKKVNGSTTETFRLLNSGATTQGVTLTYVQYGQWRRATTGSTGTSVNDTYVVFGSKSPASAVTSGTGHYATALDGTFVNKNGAYAVSGTGTFDADFLHRMISYSSTATGTPEAGGSAINFGTMTGTGSISTYSATFRGTGTANGNGYTMDVNGNFYGPNADEIGGVFNIRGNGGNGTGVIVGN
jgi:hypothetical protein